MDSKSFGPFTVKSADRGEVEAVVATVNVVDLDGDVVLPGAVRPGNRVALSWWAHDVVKMQAPPVGIGSISEDGDRLVFAGRFFLSTERGREAFETVRELGPDGKWSFGFPNSTTKTATLTAEWRARGARRLLAEFDPMEASPVFRPAGIGTGTVATKAEADAVLAEVAKFEAAVKRAGTPPNVPLPARFNAFADWLADRFALKSSDRPAVKMVLPSRLPDGATGLYDRPSRTILVSAGLSDEATMAVLAHEFAHAYEHTKNWSKHSEGFAMKMERQLLQRWHDETRGVRR